MEASSPERVEMPTNFEDAPLDHLVQLIGTRLFSFFPARLTKRDLF